MDLLILALARFVAMVLDLEEGDDQFGLHQERSAYHCDAEVSHAADEIRSFWLRRVAQGCVIDIERGSFGISGTVNYAESNALFGEAVRSEYDDEFVICPGCHERYDEGHFD